MLTLNYLESTRNLQTNYFCLLNIYLYILSNNTSPIYNFKYLDFFIIMPLSIKYKLNQKLRLLTLYYKKNTYIFLIRKPDDVFEAKFLFYNYSFLLLIVANLARTSKILSRNFQLHY